MASKARTLKGVQLSSRGSSMGSNTLGSALTDSQSTREETPSQTAKEEKFDLQGKIEDSNILSHVGKVRKEFKSTLKTRYYKEMVHEGRPLEEIYENNPPSVYDNQWKWLVERWGTPQTVQIQTIQAEQVVQEKALLEEAESRFCAEAAEQEAHLIANVEERFMKLTEI
ncbi:hypothetical protein CXB51_035232 [Gossypium anomalum]|uniref:Uncharacterized protein n=1 Tax=Gossypium anomalum TaxID=47600 RepID=A0A8J6CFM3_9ROSI|nr:hypothetical protein CXB51_035232 [Gossypium anomalum]